MPIYDYGCTNCGHVVEVVHGVHEAGPTVCPECGGLLRKRISPPAIHFRGTGWAKKDARQAIAARTGKGTSEGKGDGKDDGKEAGKDHGSSDSSARETTGKADSGAKEPAAASKSDRSTKGSDAGARTSRGQD